jgi:hypothetical protein
MGTQKGINEIHSSLITESKGMAIEEQMLAINNNAIHKLEALKTLIISERHDFKIDQNSAIEYCRLINEAIEILITESKNKE